MTIDEFKTANARALRKSTVAVFRHRSQLQPDGEPRFAIAHKSATQTMVNAGWVPVDAPASVPTEPKPQTEIRVGDDLPTIEGT